MNHEVVPLLLIVNAFGKIWRQCCLYFEEVLAVLIGITFHTTEQYIEWLISSKRDKGYLFSETKEDPSTETILPPSTFTPRQVVL